MEHLSLGIGTRVKHPQFGMGVVIQAYADSYEITFLDYGTKQIMKDFEGLEVLDYVGPDSDLLSFEKVEKVFSRLLIRYADVQGITTIGNKWRGGNIIFEPGNPGLKSKEMPVDTFFHKIVMIRDRLRVMEQRINSSNLNEDEKLNLQQYITRIYGSLTSFNIFFDDQEDRFTGEKG